MRLLVSTTILLASLHTARADQCQVVDADVADWAAKLLVKGASYVHYCEPCGDKKPTQARMIGPVEVTSVHGQKRVTVNGREEDLAYVFVQTGNSTFTNVALMTGCPTQHVSATITLQAIKVAAVIPEACRELERTMVRLNACQKMPKASRDAIRQGYEAMHEGWANVESLPQEAIAALSDACKQATDAIVQSGKAVCGW
jgi:hypothetical protein